MLSYKLNEKWNTGTLIVQDVKAWTSKQTIAKNLTPTELDHVCMCLHHIYLWHMKGLEKLGHFLTSVIRNDFKQACGRADDTNMKVLPLYSLFLYNIAPVDYQKRRT